MLFFPFLCLLVFSLSPESPPHPVLFKIAQTYDYTKEDRAMLDKAFVLLNTTVNSDDFQQNFLNAHFTETQGKTNREILRDLLLGLDNAGHIDLIMVEYDNPKSEIIGYMYENVPQIVYQNHKYMLNEYVMASNVLHETMHHLGYEHEKAWRTSVPYKAQEVFLVTLNRERDYL